MDRNSESEEGHSSEPDDMVSSSSVGLLPTNVNGNGSPSGSSSASPSSEADVDVSRNPGGDDGVGNVTISIQDFEALRSQVDEQASELSLLQTQVQLQNDRIEAQNDHIAQLLQEIKELRKSSLSVPSGIDESPSQLNPNDLWSKHQDQTAGSKSNPAETKSISELVKETAQEVLQQQEQKGGVEGSGGSKSSFVYDSASGLYFDQESGYYYDPHRQLYYNGHTRTYYSFDPKTGQYAIHSQLSPATKKKKKKTKSELRKRPVRPEFTEEQEQDLEDGEISSSNSSSSDSEDDKSSSGTVDLEDDEVEEVKVVSAPCIRGIVIESSVPSLWKGYLFLVTINGGSIGREGDHHVMQIPDPNVSKNHARISYELDDDVLPIDNDIPIANRKVTLQKKYFLCDLGSQNGTWLNKSRLSASKVPSERFEIAHGSNLRLGDTTLLLHIHEGTSTCGHCEPGLIVQDNKEPLYPLNVPSKEKQMKKEFRKISKKYGVSTHKSSQKSVAVQKCVDTLYKDRAQERRLQMGSDNPYEKTQVASLETAIQPENKGFQMLQKMGWNDGMTLGQGNSGISEPVKIAMNIGRSGLGLSGGTESPSPASPPPSHFQRPVSGWKSNKSNANSRKIQFASNTKIRKTDPAPDSDRPASPTCIQLD